MPRHAVFYGIDPPRPTDRIASREGIPRADSDSPRATTIPDQLPQIGDDDGGVGVLGVGFIDEIDDGAGGEGGAADGAVGEEAEVLGAVAQVEEDAAGGAQGWGWGVQDWDVWG